MPSIGKLWAFWQIQKLKLEDTKRQLIQKLSNEQNRSSERKVLPWKRLAYADAVVQIVVGFLIVIVVSIFTPEIINDPARLAAFWMVMFVHLFLGFLTFIALFQNSSITLKFIAATVVLLQLGVLGITSNYRAECSIAHSLPEDLKTSIISSLPMEGDCLELGFLASRVVLPNFIHSLIFSAILITYLYKMAAQSSTRPPEFSMTKDGKQKYQFRHITVIIEEIV